jgi:transcriptional regulator with XRE-family HTH domain
MTTGQKISDLRKQHALSQPQLADKLSVSQSTVAMWENDKRKVNTEDLVKISRLFNVSTDYLLGNTDIKKNVTNNNDDIALDDGLDGHKIMTYRGKEIPDEDKEILKRILGD